MGGRLARTEGLIPLPNFKGGKLKGFQSLRGVDKKFCVYSLKQKNRPRNHNNLNFVASSSLHITIINLTKNMNRN